MGGGGMSGKGGGVGGRGPGTLLPDSPIYSG